MSNRALLRIKLNREARNELEKLANDYKGEILFNALNGIGDTDRECEITAGQLRGAAEARGRLASSSDVQRSVARLESASGQFRPWLVVGVSILAGACVLIMTTLIPVVVRNEKIQILIALSIAGLFFLLIAAIGRQAQRGMIRSFHVPRLHLPHFHLTRPRMVRGKRKGHRPSSSGSTASRVTAGQGDVKAGQGNEPAVLAPPLASRAVTDRWRSSTGDLGSRLLQLSAWIPAALFAAGLAILLQFRSSRSVNILGAVRALTADPFQALVIMIALLVIATIVVQVSCSAAIRTLEGYWHRRGFANLARTLLIRRHVRRKEVIIKRRRRASERALRAAMPNMLTSGLPIPIVKAFEAQVLSAEAPRLTDEQRVTFEKTNWRDWCDAWRLARIDHLINDEEAYPISSRVLPTKLGNLIRATEDQLQNTGGDLQDFAHRRRDMVSHPQYDRSRNRLKMYCTLVFVCASLLVLTPIILLGSGISVAAITIISGSFAGLSGASYLAAVASAGGYCVALRQMDEGT
jgi:hypothetical protein